ncbi:MAG: sulfatase [Blastocatellia bacterium]
MLKRAVAVLESFTRRADDIETEKNASLLISLRAYAMLGAAAAFLLALIEWIDLNIQLTPVFASFSERLVFTSYFSLNIVIGSLIGLSVGLFVHAATFLKRRLEKFLARGTPPRLAHRLIAGLAVCALAAALLNQQPKIHAYIIGVIREAEKLPHMTRLLLKFERLDAYLTLMGLIVICSILWAVTRASKRWGWPIRAIWMVSLVAVMAVAYYIDSRIEVQLYEPSLNRSMFLANTALAFALVGTIYFSSAFEVARKKSVAALAIIILIAAVVFTFARFDHNQNLKTQLFYRTTQAKQNFRLAQWALDFDRDGYSALLGGGDPQDNQAGINPGATEVTGDSIDNNCIGGDLTAQDIDSWNREREAARRAPEAGAKRYNLIYIFVDALRADHLGTYGYNRDTSPNLDRLAARSVVFDNAFTPSPNTYQAVPKFMQSAYWDGHYETWTEVLRRNGYKTFLFPRRLAFLQRHVKGIEQIVKPGKKGLNSTVDKAIEVLSRHPQERPFCAYIYVPDPHLPFARHARFNYGSSFTDLYDGEIAFTDFQLGRLFDWLDQSGKMNDTMIVIMADHGESVGERAVYKHNSQLYNEQMRIATIFYVPTLAPRRIPDYVSSIDLGATILNTVGLDYPEQYAGVSLLPLMRGEAFSHPPIYGEQVYKYESPYVQLSENVHPPSRKYMVITQDGYKLIYNQDYYNFELYNLREDPREEHNLYNRISDRAEAMKQMVGRFIDIVTVSRPPDAEDMWVPPSSKIRR